MSEPQLSIRSAKARDLAHALARRTGQPVNKLVELALEHYDLEPRGQTAGTPMDVLTLLMAQGARRTEWDDVRHPAALNMGDCFAYAVAKISGVQLLFKGGEFSQTDVKRHSASTSIERGA